MMSKITIALAAAAIFGAASAAQANEPRDEYGGYKYGTMGQHFGTSHWRYRAPNFGFAFVPGHARVWHRDYDRRW